MQIDRVFMGEVLAREGAAPAGLAGEQVRRALEPRHSVEASAHDGDQAPAAVARSIKEAWDLLRADRQQVESSRRAVVEAREKLCQIVRKMFI